MKLSLASIILLSFFITSCTQEKKENKKGDEKIKEVFLPKNNDDAKLFSVKQNGKFLKLRVYRKDSSVIEEVFTAPRETAIPPPLKDKLIVKTPVQRIICLSATHIGFIGQLGAENSVVGISGKNYIYNPKIRAKIADGSIPDVGFEQGADIEKIIGLKPDLVTVYNIGGEMQVVIEQLKKHKIPVILINEYLEATPLGQAEWIKVFGVLFHKKEMADSIYTVTKENYKRTKKLVQNSKDKPTVFVNMPWKGTWYMSGGKSNIATIITDAGGDFLWKENQDERTTPLDFEAVYVKANKAKVWLNPGGASTLEDITNNDSRLDKFSAFASGNVYARTKRTNGLANDFLETGIVRPDIVLNDLVKIFHPTLRADDDFYFYKKLD